MTKSELLKDIEDNIKDENTKEVLKKILSKIEEKENVNKNDWVFQELYKTIMSEYDLISQRINSLLVSNSFLVTTFVLIITRIQATEEINFFTQSIQDREEILVFIILSRWGILSLLLLLISYAGIKISDYSHDNINAALKVVKYRRSNMITYQNKVLNNLGFQEDEKIKIKVDDQENKKINGDLLYEKLPRFFIYLWHFMIVLVILDLLKIILVLVNS